MHFSDWKIRTKLAATLALVALLTLLLGTVALWQMGRMAETSRTMGHETTPSVAEAGNIRAQWNRYRRLEGLLLLPQTPAQAQALAQQAASVLQGVQAAETKLFALPHPPENRVLLDNYKALRSTFTSHTQRFIPAALAYHNSDFKDEATYAALSSMYMQEVEPHFAALAEASGKLSAFKQQYAQQLSAYAADVRTSAQWWVVGVMAACATLAALMGWLLSRAITAPVAQAMQAATRIAQGDLTQPVGQHGRDEMGQLMDTMEHMRTTLSTMVQRVRQNADVVAGASQEISSGTADLSARTENQASALEETASAMEQLAATVRQNADSAHAANQLALNTSQLVTQGGDVVQQVVHNMHSISDSSRRISDITGVIDGIAFQTNILALNAAVEAARAGEQGRGFAVVAGEVRTLAQRSAEAAKEIKQLIHDSAQHVAEGSTLVERAGATMAEVQQATARVSDLVKEISAASTEQSQGVSQVGEAITQMDSATQQNAALVEESAAAAHSLQQQAQALVQAMAHFKTTGGMGSAHMSASNATRPPAPQQTPALAPATTKPAHAKAAVRAAGAAAPAPALTKPQPRHAPKAAASTEDDWESF